MSKLAELGIIWITDSEIYVADKRLYPSASDFLRDVIAHIQELIDSHSEYECGWFEAPSEECLNHVTRAWMVHRINCEWHENPVWELMEEPGRGHVPVWSIDFEQTVGTVGHAPGDPII